MSPVVNAFGFARRNEESHDAPSIKTNPLLQIVETLAVSLRLSRIVPRHVRRHFLDHKFLQHIRHGRRTDSNRAVLQR